MLSDYLIAPSLNSLLFTGIIVLFIFIIFIKNFRNFLKLPYYDKLILLSTMSIAIGMHGMIHLGVETNYGFNPYNWF
jgi:uncharacterized membrane protein